MPIKAQSPAQAGRLCLLWAFIDSVRTKRDDAEWMHILNNIKILKERFHPRRLPTVA
ncbi:MAG: hypothetical protein AAB449_01215 [Patescibacteria group bacterium]